MLGDRHGNLIHLGERECSIQRRHQKVVEEAPSPFLDDKTRNAMGKEALALAKAVDYSSAGTVEFIVDKDKNFYFLEMNTRLQVEHPVTEYITGLDLVEQMIRVAAGEKLALTQKDIKLSGWAIEARVYAEDPARNFLPSIGRLVRYREPICGDAIRVDSGVVEGSEISVFYDPMIAKLVSGGKNRAEAIDNMAKALGSYTIQGISHNLAFLAAVVENQRFRDGALSTNFIAEEFPDGFSPLEPSGEMRSHFIAIIAFAVAKAETRAKATQSRPYVAVIGGPKGAALNLDVSLDGKGGVINVDGATVQIESDWRQGDGAFSGRVNGVVVNAGITPLALGYRLISGALALELVILSPVRAAMYSLMPIKQAPDLSKYLLSPMPGLLLQLSVSEGTAVKAGEELAVVEAMKMENVLRAERDGTVSKICTSAGENLNLDQVILEFED